MTYVVISSACFVFIIFVALFYKIGKNADRKNRRLNRIAGKTRGIVDEELSLPIVQRFLAPAFHGIIKSFSRVLPRKEKRQSSRLEKKLQLAGIRILPSEYIAIRFVFVFGVFGMTIAIIALAKIATVVKTLIYVGGMSLALIGPSLYMSLRIKSRQLAIRNQLPDILDLMSVGVEAGLSFDGALLYIEQFSFGPLVDELTTVKKEIQMGLPRREALKKLSERNNVPELNTFVGALVQSDQIGLPLRNVMRAQASQLRLSRKQAAEEKAMKAPVKMMLPLIAFVFPVTFIILMGPAVLSLIETFGG